METTIRPKNFKLQGDLEEQIRKRIERLTRHLPNVTSTEIVLAQQPTHLTPQRFQYIIQVTLVTRNGNLIRSEVRHPELLTGVDDACAHLSRQITRFKARYERRKRGAVGLGRTPVMDQEAATFAELPSLAEMAAPAAVEAAVPDVARVNGQGDGAASAGDTEGDEETGTIVRVKGFSVKPMFPEDAIEQMELLGHNFYVFMNAADEQVVVVYRRNDGNYGLIQPEFG